MNTLIVVCAQELKPPEGKASVYIVPLDRSSQDNSAIVGHACSLFGPHRQRWIPGTHNNHRQG